MLAAGITGAGAIAGGSTLTAVSQPTLGIGQNNQLAGNLTLTPTVPVNTFAAGEQVVITVDDSVPGNCTSATNFVSFTSVPTVTVSGTATATPSLSSSPGACTAAGKTDRLIITFGALAGTATLTISNVRYDVGSSAAVGPVVLTATDSDASLVTTAAASNAFLTDARLSANTPPVGLLTGSGVQNVSNLVIAEQAADALSPINNLSGRFCVQLQGGASFDNSAPAPTLAVSGGGDTATVALFGGGTALDVIVTDSASDTTATTFTISGLRLNAATTATAGLKSALLFRGPCSAPISPLSSPTSPITVAGVVTTNRIDGADRFLTAQKLFEGATTCVGTGLANAIIARSDDFPDALAASFLAGKMGTAILLVDRNSTALPAATINALKNRGVDKVTIIGGTTAVPATLANALGTLQNFDCAGAQQGTLLVAVDRIDGIDRYETARKVAEAGNALPGGVGTADYDGTALDPDGPACTPRRTAILATGTAFPDALVAGPVAYNGHNIPGAGTPFGCGDGTGFPVILTPSTSLDPQAASALTTLGIQQVLVMGGNTAIAPAVETAVQGINSITTKRFAGTTRLDTAKQFAEFAIDFLGYDRNVINVARGDDFPDALAGGPYAGTPRVLPVVSTASVIILTESPASAGAETLAFVKDRQGTVGVYGAPTPLTPITAVNVFGGLVAVTDATVASILASISQA